MALALDGSAHGNSGSAGSLAVSLTTSNANDVIIVVATVNGGPVTGVTGSGLTFSLIKRQASSAASPAPYIEYWRAIASSALSAVSITVTQTSSDFITVDAFGISGANTTTPEDANASTPAGATSSPLSVTTDTADCFIFGGRRLGSSPNTAGSGFTLLSGSNFQVAEYKIVSTTQTALSVGTGSGTADGAIADAIVIAAGGNVTVALTGASSTVSAGSLVPSRAVPISGIASTLSPGTVTVGSDVTVALTGIQATASPGSLTPSRVVPITGSATTLSAGTVAPSTSKAISGIAATSGIGSVTPSGTVALTGQAVTATPGSVGIVGDVTVAITGIAMTVSAGNVSVLAAASTGGGAWTGKSSGAQKRRKTKAERGEEWQQTLARIANVPPVEIPPPVTVAVDEPAIVAPESLPETIEPLSPLEQADLLAMYGLLPEPQPIPPPVRTVQQKNQDAIIALLLAA